MKKQNDIPDLRLPLGKVGVQIDIHLLNIMAAEILKPNGLICILDEPLPGHKKINLQITDLETKNGHVTISAKRIGMVLMDECCNTKTLTPIDIPDLANGAFLKFTLDGGCKLSIIVPKEERPVLQVAVKEATYCPSKNSYVYINKLVKPYYYDK
ncbi:hypothetical protein TSMG0092 [Halocynthia phage JM-2012]|uniref:hypothetical protein n=1 Tax=Halocynthia phage JM-2012 TaxID=1173297 RepID=UPI00025C6930|nr:hypothetical protein TSMG0092 [Halocynthia phage JM-2012]AFI55375.1 hypothetical protein TSMG0092 [Halocynthia phage JM-2012]